MPRGSNSHAFSTRSDDRPGSSKRLVSVVVDPKTDVSEKKTSGKDGKTGTSGKKSACPASDAPHSPQVLCAKPSHVSCAKSGSALHTEPFHADGESAVTCAQTDSVSQHNSSVSAQKICAVRKTATEERVVRKTPDLDIFPSVSQQAIFRGKVGHDLENRGENAMIPALTQVPSTLKNAGVAVAQTRV